MRCPFNSRSLGLLAASLVVLLIVKPLAAEDFTSKQDQQKQVREDTDRLVRRLGTMVRVLEYYQLDAAGQKTMLAEVAATLNGLSRDQMAEIMARFGAAAIAADDTKTEKELEAAYKRHREVILTLRALLDRHDAIRSLDQAAARLGKMAEDQLERYLQTVRFIDEAQERLTIGQPASAAKSRSPTLALRLQADEQADLHTDLGKLLRQVGALKPHLALEERERVQRLEQQVKKREVLEDLTSASDKLRATGYPENRLKEWKLGNDLQWKTAHELLDLAQLLRGPLDKLAALREARDRLDGALSRQEKLGKETGSHKDQPPAPQDADKLREMADLQARLALETTATRSLLQPHAGDLAAKLASAKAAMTEAMKGLQAKEASKATKPQKQAAADLKDVRDKLADMIAQAELQRKQISPADAAQQLAKAIEQAQQAASQSEQAAQASPATPASAQAMSQSQKATQAAMNSLGQAQAQAPQMVQGMLQKAAGQLAQAKQQLGQGAPKKANKSQNQAISQMSKALQAMNAAAAALGQPSATPGKAGTAVASAASQAQGQGQGKGQTPGQGTGQAQGPGPGPGLSQQASSGVEKNQGQGLGNRIADGKVNNAASQLMNVSGDGSYLHLPPRQRELIRQAAADRLPPEYAPLIQQYFMNLARGRPAVPTAPSKR
jgi:hypothetical protein